MTPIVFQIPLNSLPMERALTYKSHVLNMNSEHPYREEFAATGRKDKGGKK